MIESWPRSRLEHATRIGAILAVAAYGIGFLVISAYDNRFGIVEFDIVRSRLLVAGIWCMAYLSLLLLLTVGLPSGLALIPHADWPSKLFDLSFTCTFTPFITLPLMARRDHWMPNLPNLIFITVIFVVGIAAKVTSLMARRPWLRGTVLLLCFAVIVIEDLRLSSGAVRAESMWILGVGFLVYLAPASLEEMREKPGYYAQVWAIPAIVAVSAFGGVVYPSISSRFGGGSPSPVTVCFGQVSQASSTRAVKAGMVDEADRGFYVLIPESSKEATFIPRALVTAVYFGRDPKTDVCDLSRSSGSVPSTPPPGGAGSPKETPPGAGAKAEGDTHRPPG